MTPHTGRLNQEKKPMLQGPDMLVTVSRPEGATRGGSLA